MDSLKSNLPACTRQSSKWVVACFFCIVLASFGTLARASEIIQKRNIGKLEFDDL